MNFKVPLNLQILGCIIIITVITLTFVFSNYISYPDILTQKAVISSVSISETNSNFKSYKQFNEIDSSRLTSLFDCKIEYDLKLLSIVQNTPDLRMEIVVNIMNEVQKITGQILSIRENKKYNELILTVILNKPLLMLEKNEIWGSVEIHSETTSIFDRFRQSLLKHINNK
jgi:hypothetical protein